MHVWIINDKGKKKRISIKKLIEKYNPYILSIAKKWIRNFNFDRSIGVEDIHQELIVKLYFSLGKYNPELASVRTYMRKICTNYLITKKKILTQEKNIPLDTNGKILHIISLHASIDQNLTLEEIIEGNEPKPDTELKYIQFVKLVQHELDKITYCPTGYKPRLRNFVRVLFDTLFLNKKKFSKKVLFNHRCRIRYARNHGIKVPNKVVPRARTVAEYLNVDIRAVNLGMRLIKKIIKKNSMN